MAIKVGGTSVIDDSRNLQNIASVDATTLAAFTSAGMGDITAVTAGSGLTGGGTSGAVTVNHADTSSQGSVNNSGNTVIQDITLDTYGHITNINSTTISAGASTDFGAVGTYALLHWLNSGSQIPSTTTSGSNLYPALTWDNDTGASGYYSGGGAMSGTWRLMGQLGYYNGTISISRSDFRTSVWVRIS